MMNKFRQWMYGRYGNDEMGMALWLAALVILLAGGIVGIFAKTAGTVLAYIVLALRLISVGLLVWMMLRMFSKNIAKRRAENYKWLTFWRKLKGIFRKRPDAKTHRYFKCPSCRQTVRVPKNKGKISITCPKCGTKFIKKT